MPAGMAKAIKTRTARMIRTTAGQLTPSALLITRTRGTPITAITASTAKPTSMNTVIHIPSSLQKELTPSLHAWPSPEPPCLLYTSDAADDLTRVDLGGRGII